MNKYFSYIIGLIVVFTSCKKDNEFQREDDFKGITMTTTIVGDMKIYLTGTGKVFIDWGDGNRETVMLNNSDNIFDSPIPHTYAKTGVKKIVITGNNIVGLSTNTAFSPWGSTSKITALDVSRSPKLKFLYCLGELLTSLDVSKNTELEILICDVNRLSLLNVSNNTKLKQLSCSNNQLLSLDISKNIALEYLNCANNKLTSLDVSNNTVLKQLICDYNRLTSLDVSKNTVLEYLLCSNNQLASLDVSGCTVLEYLYCHENKLTSLDVSNNTVLKNLYCYGNLLTSLVVSNFTEMVALACNRNNLNYATLNAIFDALPNWIDSYSGRWVDVRDNPGITQVGYDRTIATDKNWRVTEFDHQIGSR